MLSTLKILFIIILFLILILVTVIAIANVLFNRRADNEAREVLSSAELDQKDIIQQSALKGLPLCVQNWMQRSGVVGQEKIHTVRLIQKGRMRLKPDKAWMPIEAVQYINVDKPGFVWKARVKMAPLIYLQGKDRYFNGHGSMQIKLFSLLTVVNSQLSEEMDQSTLVRYLAEMMWYPSAALNKYINWEEVNANSARATMCWQGVKASMLFNFNEDGDVINSMASRYQEVKGKFILNDWGGVPREYRVFKGIRLANKSDVVWIYTNGDFNWLQIEVTDIDFNPVGLY